MKLSCATNMADRSVRLKLSWTNENGHLQLINNMIPVYSEVVNSWVIGSPSIILDIDKNGLEDVVKGAYYGTQGLGLGCDLLIFSQYSEGKFCRFLIPSETFSPEDISDFDGDGTLEIVTCMLLGSGRHNYWVYRCWKLEGDRLVCVDKPHGFPRVIWFTDKPNLRLASPLLVSSVMSNYPPLDLKGVKLPYRPSLPPDNRKGQGHCPEDLYGSLAGTVVTNPYQWCLRRYVDLHGAHSKGGLTLEDEALQAGCICLQYGWGDIEGDGSPEFFIKPLETKTYASPLFTFRIKEGVATFLGAVPAKGLLKPGKKSAPNSPLIRVYDGTVKTYKLTGKGFELVDTTSEYNDRDPERDGEPYLQQIFPQESMMEWETVPSHWIKGPDQQQTVRPGSTVLSTNWNVWVYDGKTGKTIVNYYASSNLFASYYDSLLKITDDVLYFQRATGTLENRDLFTPPLVKITALSA